MFEQNSFSPDASAFGSTYQDLISLGNLPPTGVLPELSGLWQSLSTSGAFSSSALINGVLDSATPSNPTRPDTYSDRYLLDLVIGQQVQVGRNEVIESGAASDLGPFEPNDAIPEATDTGLANDGTATFSAFIGDGNNGDTSGDYDWFSLTAGADQTITIDIETQSLGSSLDSYVGLYDSSGTLLASNDDSGGSLDSFLEFTAAADDTYYVVVQGYGSGFQSDPFDPSSGGGVGSTGEYEVEIGIDSGGEVVDPTLGSFAPTGDPSIDALLSELGNYWDTSSNGGVITYSFLSSEAADSYYGSENVSELNEETQDNVREILESLEAFIDVDFVEVEDTDTSYGVVRFMYSDGPEYAYAYLPSEGDIAGDVHLNPDDASDFSSGFGSYGYETLIHETFHALGLKHPGDYFDGAEPEPYLPPEEDNNTNTVMTYNFAGTGGTTPMPYDIQALQYLYGATDYNSGDTTYSFDTVYGYTDGSQSFGSSTTELKQTLWDSGGTDVLDFSDLASLDSGYYFDLSEGGILTTQEAYNGSTYTDASTGGTYTTTTFGTAIAYDTVVEDLINSTSDDYIIANSIGNTFSGYTEGTGTGDDIYEGTDSLDLLILSSYELSDLTTTIDDTDLSIDLGSYGSIEILDYYGTDESMVFLIEDEYYTYSESGDWEVAEAPLSVDSLEASGSDTGVTESSSPVVLSSSVTSDAKPPQTPSGVRCTCSLCSSASASSFYQVGSSNLSDLVVA